MPKFLCKHYIYPFWLCAWIKSVMISKFPFQMSCNHPLKVLILLELLSTFLGKVGWMCAQVFVQKKGWYLSQLNFTLHLHHHNYIAVSVLKEVGAILLKGGSLIFHIEDMIYQQLIRKPLECSKALNFF